MFERRCARSGRECVYTAPEKRRRRKRTDTRVAELEHMVQMLAARLEDEQRARIEQHQMEKHSPQPHKDGFNTDPDTRQPARTQNQSASKEAGLRRGTARQVNRTAVASSSRSQTSIMSPSIGSSSPSISVKSSDAIPINHLPSSSSATTRAFGPSPSLDYTKRSTIPDSLQVGPWPAPPNTYLSPSSQQASHGDFYSPHPSPSQSVSLASTASPQTEESWPSPEQDFGSLYPESYFHPIDDKTGLPLLDPSAWWMESDGNMANQAGLFDAVATHPYSAAYGQSQQWDFSCPET
ncbi:MAG: hypothetical protein LQ346_007148 [Caloplaca aetnensis]|nr:MAG: hypothetical protein LQ346_007148 [Caloplaca aetnensis]